VSLLRRSNCQTLATASAASVKHLTTTLGRHPLTKSVGRVAASLTWLIRALHGEYYLTSNVTNAYLIPVSFDPYISRTPPGKIRESRSGILTTFIHSGQRKRRYAPKRSDFR
jgi:hypothetical protein